MGKEKNAFFLSGKWDIIKTVLVLTAIALISGLLLGGVNSFTQVDEAQMMAGKLAAVMPGEVFNADETLVQETAEGTVEKAFRIEGKDTAVMYLASAKGYGGSVQLFVLVEDNKIAKISVFAASETPGLGDKVLKKGVLFERFVGIDVTTISGFTMSKTAGGAAGTIEAVSGSTVTSNAVGSALSAVAECHNKNIAGGVL